MRAIGWLSSLTGLVIGIAQGESIQEFASLCPSQNLQSVSSAGTAFRYYCHSGTDDYYHSLGGLETPDACAQECLKSELCTGAIWNAKIQQCYLTETTEMPEIDTEEYTWSIYMLRGEPSTKEPDDETITPICPPGYHFSFGRCVEQGITICPDCSTDPEKIRCEQERETYIIDQEQCQAEKASCNSQKDICNAQMTACETEKSTYDNQRARCTADKEALEIRNKQLEKSLNTCNKALQAATKPPPPPTCPGAANGRIRSQSGKNFKLYCHHGISSGHWLQLTGHSFAGCLQACAGRNACISFDWYPVRGNLRDVCYLKDGNHRGNLKAQSISHAAIRV